MTAPRSRIGASIACSGAASRWSARQSASGRTSFAVDAAAETLRVTTVGRWRPGTRVNLERALKIGDELGGHMVSGHVDGIAEMSAREDCTDMARLTLRAPAPLARFIASEGLGRARRRIADGQRRRGRHILGPDHPAHARGHDVRRAAAGDPLNLEVDLMARYAARLMETR